MSAGTFSRSGDLNPEAYLTDVLARINDPPNKRRDDLLHWNWQPLSA
jgi:hypothetical protein